MKLTLKELVKEQVPPQAIIVAAFVAMCVIGYGIWSSETSGSFTVTAPLYSTEVFVDTTHAGTLKNPGDTMTFTYASGRHTVIVSRAGYVPWQKNLDIVPKQTVALSPFLVREEIAPEQITPMSFSNGTISINADYAEAAALFSKLSIANDIVPLVASTSIKDVRSADYYPGRKDVLLIAARDGIFAVDAIQNDPRNFQPVYKGTSPIFVKTANGVIFIKDGDDIFRIAGIN
ncbi:MAG: hypothetical protein WC878_02375 [Candidatus Paceibacterota bacterium]|jgi:hypothetical protein